MIERSRRRHINIQMILRVMGWLLMIEAAFMLVPLVTGLIYDEMKDVKVFGLTSVITFGCGVLLTFGLHPRDTRMGRHEGFLLTTLIWILFSAFGMIPFMLCDRPVSLTNAFFEAMSGFTTTGCSIFSSIDTYSHSIKMWRGLMNWIGGMGIILFTTDELDRRHVNHTFHPRRITNAQPFGWNADVQCRGDWHHTRQTPPPGESDGQKPLDYLYCLDSINNSVPMDWPYGSV